MKKNKFNVYATNKGKVTAPKKQEDEPKATKTAGDDLRTKKRK